MAAKSSALHDQQIARIRRVTGQDGHERVRVAPPTFISLLIAPSRTMTPLCSKQIISERYNTCVLSVLVSAVQAVRGRPFDLDAIERRRWNKDLNRPSRSGEAMGQILAFSGSQVHAPAWPLPQQVRCASRFYRSRSCDSSPSTS